MCSPFAFLLGWSTFGLAGGADSVKPCPTTGGHPEGVGLEGIRGASYALDVLAKQKRVRNLSGTGNKLQVYVSTENAFHRFLYLAVEPSFQPRYNKTVGYKDQRARIGYFDKGCSGKPRRCLSKGKVMLHLL